jgi:glycosyltransferase involved in cell wall biosynthesis
MSLISVIIPVYNSELYVQKAIDSVLEQLDDIEIVIVDDASTDASLSICKKMASGNANIRIVQHLDKKNHGRSASRNLGIKNAKGKYIAFLDADDYYLPNRFANDIKILEEGESIDGVYNAISAHFYRDFSLIEKNKLQLTTVREIIAPDKLFESMGPIGHLGYFSGIGLTVKKSIFEKTGFFNELLIVAEDTELWIKMALVASLKSGIIDKPLAMRGVHDNNSSFNEKDLYRVNNLLMYESLLNWSFKKNVPISRIDLLWKKIWINRELNNKRLNSNLFLWIKSVVNHPSLLLLKRVYKTFPVFKRVKRILNNTNV